MIPSYVFPKNLRLLVKRQFKRVGFASNKMVGDYILIQWAKNSLPLSRLGIIVSRKFGKSHERNRFKRLIREAFRLSHYDLPTGLDLVIMPRNGAIQAKLEDILEDLSQISLVVQIEKGGREINPSTTPSKQILQT